MIQFPGTYGGMIRFTWDRLNRRPPDSVLILVMRHGQLLFTRHQIRGWELPGGKLEEEESPLAAAVRETYEETGVLLDSISWIGQYEAEGGQPPYLCKWIYFADAYTQLDLPFGYETVDSKWLSTWPTPEEVSQDPEFSPLLKDGVYKQLYERYSG